jgi:hypothetical protein
VELTNINGNIKLTTVYIRDMHKDVWKMEVTRDSGAISLPTCNLIANARSEQSGPGMWVEYDRPHDCNPIRQAAKNGRCEVNVTRVNLLCSVINSYVERSFSKIIMGTPREVIIDGGRGGTSRQIL